MLRATRDRRALAVALAIGVATALAACAERQQQHDQRTIARRGFEQLIELPL